MPNPVEILVRASRRIAQVAAFRTIAYALLPAVVATALAVSIQALGRVTWERRGYALAPSSEQILIDVLVVVAALTLLIAAALAVRSYLRARDFVGAAMQVDDAVGGRQQVLTFASLADPSAPEAVKSRRSPLFPLLWRSAAGFLESFDPRRAFPLGLARPIARSSILASGFALATILATLGLLRPPSPLQAEAIKLREIAADIEKSSTTPGDSALASAIRGAADALENPNLPPEEKRKRLEQVMQEMASHSEQKQGGGNQAGSGPGNGATRKDPNGNTSGSGEGSGGAKGAGAGAGQNQSGKGSGKNDKGSQGKDSIELQNEMAKAEALVESAGDKNSNPNPSSAGDKDKNPAQQAGNKPNEKAPGNEPNPKEPGDIPKQTGEGNRNVQQAGGNQASGKDQGSNQGDTHMGDIPAVAKTQRYLKPGEKGDALNIHDARYVMFRLPSAIPVGSGGITVLDPNRTKATTPYVNAPLKETSNDAPPDERQLVPPRYRDLIH